jgi:signal transduction histidine kinase
MTPGEQFNSNSELLSARSLQACWAYPAFVVMLYASSGYTAVAPGLFYSVAAAIFALSLTRYYLIRFSKQGNLVQGVRLCIYANGAVWGAFFASTIARFGYGAWETTFLLVSTAGVAGGSVSAHASDLNLSRWYLRLMLVPGIVVQLLHGGAQGIAMAGLFSLYLIYLVVQAKIEAVNREGRARDTRLLEQRARELEAAREAAEAATVAKTAFLANMSHELRTPLNSIIGYAEMVMDEMNDEGQTRHLKDLQRILGAGQHQLALVSEILDYSKIEAGRMGVYRESFDVAEVVREVVAQSQPLAAKNSNRLELEEEDGLGWMTSDVTKVRQILFNLLSNACKFTEGGLVRCRARRLPGAPDWLELTVEDNGIGINPRQIELLFQPFTQADASTTRRYGGTGLGLAITRHYCEMLSGTVTVESQTGLGSVFTVHLPGGAGSELAMTLDAERHSHAQQPMEAGQ